MTIEKLREILNDLAENGGSITIKAKDGNSVAIAVPKNSSIATLEKLVNDMCDRFERMVEND